MEGFKNEEEFFKKQKADETLAKKNSLKPNRPESNHKIDLNPILVLKWVLVKFQLLAMP